MIGEAAFRLLGISDRGAQVDPKIDPELVKRLRDINYVRSLLREQEAEREETEKRNKLEARLLDVLQRPAVREAIIEMIREAKDGQ